MDIFVSYAREDAEVVRALAEALERHGWSVSWDRDIPAGSRFASHIEEHLAAARCVLVLWSRSSVGSEWVRDEATEAKDGNKLVPVLIDDVKPPIGFRQIQSADLIRWKGDVDDPKWTRLLRDLDQMLGPPVGRRVAAPEPAPQKVTMPSVLIHGGTFWMGAQSEDPDAPNFDPDVCGNESPVRRVTLSKFRIARFPVTVRDFLRFVEAGEHGYLDGSLWTAEGWAWRLQPSESSEDWEAWGVPLDPEERASLDVNRYERLVPDSWSEQLRNPERPVVGVSWYEASAFARWIGGALPTEAQWEFTARGSTSRKYPWGKEPPSHRHANFGMRIGAPSAFGAVAHGATPDGVQDLAGNVWEWCEDWYARYGAGAETDPTGPRTGFTRVTRGGSFRVIPKSLGGAIRMYERPDASKADLGFRVVFGAAGGRV